MLRTVQRSWRLITSRQQITISVLAGIRIVANLLDVVGVLLVGVVLALALGVQAELLLNLLPGLSPREMLVALTLTAGALFYAKTALGIALARTTSFYFAKIESLLSVEIANWIFTGNLPRARTFSRAEVHWSVLFSTNIALTELLGQLITFITELSSIIFIFALLFLTDWRSAIGVTVYLSVLILLIQLSSRRASQAAGSAVAEGSIAVNNALSDLQTAFREISVMSRTGVFLERISESREAVARGMATYNYLIAMPRYIVELGLILGALGLATFQLLARDTVDYLVIGIFMAGGLRMMSSALPVLRSFQSVRFNMALAESAQDMLSEIREEATEGGKAEFQHVSHSVTGYPNFTGTLMSVDLRNVSFRYPEGDQSINVLDEITFSISPGSTVAIIGPSGAGKSTLVDLILGLLPPSSGEIVVSGVPPNVLRSLNSGLIGYVPQKPGVVSGTIEANIAIGIPAGEVDRVKLWDAIDVAQLRDVVTALPDGVETDLGKHSDSLSGGQLQRIGVARALYTKPGLLVLDEATSALDAETEASVYESFEGLDAATTIIIVAHRLSTIQKADAIIVLDEGKVIASGTFQELRRSSQLVRRHIELMTFDG